MTASAKLNQPDFDLYVTKYIAMSSLPFNHIDSDAFCSFIKQVAPRMKLKDRKVYAGKAADLTKSMKSELIIKPAEVDVDH